MFNHLTVLISFIFALALSHLLTSSTELIWARDRVRFSWLQALWMANALIALITGWIGIFYLSSRTNWDMAEILINVVWALIQYFSCSLISIRPSDAGIVDMPAFFERQRPYIMTAFVAMMLAGMFANWWDRNMSPDPYNWLYENLDVLPMAVFSAMGFGRAKWLQWAGGIGLLVISIYFLFADIATSLS